MLRWCTGRVFDSDSHCVAHNSDMRFKVMTWLLEEAPSLLIVALGATIPPRGTGADMNTNALQGGEVTGRS